MDKKPIKYKYNGEMIYIYPGNFFSKNELILRLKEMNFTNVDSTYDKQDLITMYEIATSYENNIEKIISKLRKDYQYMKLREKFKNENKREEMDDNNNHNNSFFNNFGQRILFDNNRNNNIPSINNNNSNNDQSNSSDNSSNKSWSSYFFEKLKEFIFNHKFDLLQKLLCIIAILCMDLIISYISKKYGFLGYILRLIRKILTPKRLIILFLLYHVITYIVNSLLYYVFGFGIFGFLLLVFKDKIIEFILNI